jgi:DNA-binding NtrC family response regulator
MEGKLKILFVEDNQDDLMLLQHEIKKGGIYFDSQVAQTQEEFEEALNLFQPEIILSDYSLPHFDGITAFTIAKSKSPHTPFIIVSGTIGEENAVELIKSGLTDYVVKDKLFTVAPKIKRALKEVEEKLEKHVADEKLRLQNEKLFEIAFLQSHQVRRPVANLIGIGDLFNYKDPCDPKNVELMERMKTCVKELDGVIAEIVQKTESIKDIQHYWDAKV